MRPISIIICYLALAPTILLAQMNEGSMQGVEVSSAESTGSYKGTVQVEWNPDGRTMILLAPFSYVDRQQLEWMAAKGTVTDGASIPRVAWSAIGGPFEGLYREAAVIHDAACQLRERTWEATHRMFYQAMLTSHVDPVTAKVMYAAVFHFGPRWVLSKPTSFRKTDGQAASELAEEQERAGATNSTAELTTEQKIQAGPLLTIPVVRFIPQPPTLKQDDFAALTQWIEAREAAKPGSVTLEQIRNYAPSKRRKQKSKKTSPQ